MARLIGGNRIIGSGDEQFGDQLEVTLSANGNEGNEKSISISPPTGEIWEISRIVEFFANFDPQGTFGATEGDCSARLGYRAQFNGFVELKQDYTQERVLIGDSGNYDGTLRRPQSIDQYLQQVTNGIVIDENSSFEVYFQNTTDVEIDLSQTNTSLRLQVMKMEA